MIRQKKQEKEEEYIRKTFPEMMDDSSRSDEISSSDSSSTESDHESNNNKDTVKEEGPNEYKKKEEEERMREEARKKKEEEERRRKEEEERKLEEEREMAMKRREHKSLTIKQMELGCYKSNNININKPIRINTSHINIKHIMAAKGYLRELAKTENIELNMLNDDIVNEIIYFYAKPCVFKIKINSHLQFRRHRDKQKDTDLIKCILYCPIDDKWHTLMSNIFNSFNLSPWTDIPGFYYIDNDNQRTFISKQIWNKNEFKVWNIDNIFEMEDEERYRERIRTKRENSIRIARKKRRQKRQEKEEEYIRKQFAEMMDDSSRSDEISSSYSSSTESDHEQSLQWKLRNFDKIASTGQLFLKYTGKRRRKPQDRIVKVTFDNKYKPKEITWGSGSRHIAFNEILYVSWGHWTPVFQAKKDGLDEKLCFSVVGKQQTLDVQAQNEKIAELWVKGLRKLIGHSDDKSDRLARQGLDGGFENDIDIEQVEEMNNEMTNNMNDNNKMIIIGGIVVIGIVLIVALNRKRFFG